MPKVVIRESLFSQKMPEEVICKSLFQKFRVFYVVFLLAKVSSAKVSYFKVAINILTDKMLTF